MLFLLVTFFIINHLIFTMSFPPTSTPSPLCRRLEAFSRSQLMHTPLDLKMFSQHGRTLYLIDEVDDLYELSISKQTANWLNSKAELPLFWTETEHSGKEVIRWAQPVGKWYNHPWLRLDTVNSPLVRLLLFSDPFGMKLWRQYFFADGRHCLVNNRTGRVVAVNRNGKEKEFRDYLVINNNLNGLLFHYDNYSWMRSSNKLSLEDRQVVFRLTNKKKGRQFYMITNANRSALHLSNSKPISTSNDLILKLPIGGLIADRGKKLFLLTGKFTREVIIVEDFKSLKRSFTVVSRRQKWQAIRTKSWSSFFRCFPETDTTSKGLDQPDYEKVASMVVDNRKIPGSFWAKVAAYLIASVIVLTGCFFIYPRSTEHKKAREVNPNLEGSSSSSSGSTSFSLTSRTSSPLDRKSKLRLSDLKLNNKRSSRGSSSSSSSSSVLDSKPNPISEALGKLPKELTTIKPLDCSSIESINLTINQR